jgi:hypothetical protein
MPILPDKRAELAVTFSAAFVSKLCSTIQSVALSSVVQQKTVKSNAIISSVNDLMSFFGALMFEEKRFLAIKCLF